MKWRHSLLLIVLTFLTLGMSECSQSDIDSISTMVDEWARAKNISPTNPDGTPNIQGGVNAARNQLAGTGNKEVDGTLSLGGTLEKMKESEDLSNKAISTLDMNAANAAISKSPKDYHYHNVKAILNLANGSTDSGGAYSDALSAATEQYKPITDKIQSTDPVAKVHPVTVALMRDRMNIIAQMWPNKNISNVGRNNLGREYCENARHYSQSEKDDSYLARAASMGMACN